MNTLTELEQQINQAEAKVNELREQLAAQKKSERASAISTVRDLIKVHGLSAVELGLNGKSTAGTKIKTNDKRSRVAAKYKDPATGITWTGRGKTPAWLNAQIKAGRNKQDFLI